MYSKLFQKSEQEFCEFFWNCAEKVHKGLVISLKIVYKKWTRASWIYSELCEISKREFCEFLSNFVLKVQKNFVNSFEFV